ncbi:MAG: VWA domain-containing protein [Nannocystis sp.]|nr:vWA domain-containing protein [Nannocystis sp.]MBA3547516.1 VWA domain-containing protein [Nannocystis sp.]
MRRWPVTTIAGLGGVVSLAVLVAIGSPDPQANTLRTADAEIARAYTAASPSPVMSAEELAASPSSVESKAVYAMRGPKDGGPSAADSADVWGSLAGTEIGEAYGVGGLGLVGTGRGGGGTGEGTIGLGSVGMMGKGGGSGAGYGRGGGRSSGLSEGKGRYDKSLQSGVLTVGTVDDNADAAGYKKALKKLASEREALGIPEDMWQLTPRQQRHDERPGGLDIALVVDTTGSMGDELEYLKVEIRGIALEISEKFPDVEQRWGLVVYRDDGDAYVTQKADFQGIDAFVTALGAQEAGGGGDTPEAMDAAMIESSGLAWRTDDATARVVFLVADAPTHAGAAAKRFASSVQQHRDAGTAIYPVGASGVDPAAEAELRLAARATGGQYIFLTDHSGVGGHHAPPKVDQFKVETLNAAMTRMIGKELGAAKGGPRSKPMPPPPRTADVVTSLVVPAEPVVEPVFEPVHAPVAEPALGAMLMVMAPAAEPLSLWDDLKQRLAAHLLFASSIAALVFAAMGVDAFIGRRRRMVLRDRARRG